ncbi:MAG: Holliday junction branch migration protein RuvA [Candidatus Marinimicrobia bacterium]|jgi:Holliday junction DNA helicase RuvA|nr:Holliday junction branch migration protein RuvA [Candidatus Neomarinimicrobiota bacterium]MDD4962198.1 Holliday junction branch migration protein RuvA [Candidatus Neomarinimicrobiota bacterium]MDD5709104.1 Holliday junction branch migration protein RuvA [Candidatus Neomarinimicrobiota bacterium]MDX9778038.1 Holliday junction branch migration protein RuvA [bacterium]
MIAFLQGRIEVKKPNSLILNIQNVGMECLISLHTYEKLPAAGNSCKLLTYLHVREDLLQLYGFINEKEKEVFLKLISLSGIGPKQAINILSGIRYDHLTAYILNGDVAAVKRAPGVGEKTARRIILELKEKISDEEVSSISGIPSDSPLSANVADALLALESLGYKRSAIQNIIAKFIKEDETISTETIIKRFLTVQNK